MQCAGAENGRTPEPFRVKTAERVGGSARGRQALDGGQVMVCGTLLCGSVSTVHGVLTLFSRYPVKAEV